MRTPEQKARYREQKRLRYINDPEFRAQALKRAAANKKNRKKKTPPRLIKQCSECGRFGEHKCGF